MPYTHVSPGNNGHRRSFVIVALEEATAAITPDGMPGPMRGQDAGIAARGHGGAARGEAQDFPRHTNEDTDMANGTNNQGGNNGGGFGSMDEERQREIAAEGGRAAHESGNAHEFTSEEAREAGRKGGEAVSQDREHMAEIGRMGGEASNGGGGSGGQGGSEQQEGERGFAAMDPEERSEIARKGGEASGGGNE
jgi:hypothetical protein